VCARSRTLEQGGILEQRVQVGHLPVRGRPAAARSEPGALASAVTASASAGPAGTSLMFVWFFSFLARIFSTNPFATRFLWPN